MSHQQNLTRIKTVYQALGELGEQVVFIGGATVSLYTDRKAEEIRPTDDVDVLIEVAGYGEYSSIEEKLRQKGFANDRESHVICRYRVQGIIVDMMPTKEEILGFSNRWYTESFKHATSYLLDHKHSINILEAPYFLATKLEAYRGRGENDGRWSTDFEDIVYLLNNRSLIWQEIATTGTKLKDYFLVEFTALLRNPYLDEWVSSHLEYADQSRVPYIVGSMKDFLESNR